MNTLVLKRWALRAGNRPVEEISYFIPADGDSVVDVSDPRLIKLEGYTGKWFWYRTDKFLGDTKFFMPGMPAKPIHPYLVPLAQDVTLITELQYNAEKAKADANKKTKRIQFENDMKSVSASVVSDQGGES